MSINSYRFLPPFIREYDRPSYSSECTLEFYNQIVSEYEANPEDLICIGRLLSVLQGYLFGEIDEFGSDNRGKVNSEKKQVALMVIDIIQPLRDLPYMETVYYALMAQNYIFAGDLDKAGIYYKALLEIPGFADINNVHSHETALMVIKNLMVIYSLQDNKTKCSEVYNKSRAFFDEVRDLYERLIIKHPNLQFRELKRLSDKSILDTLYFESSSSSLMESVLKLDGMLNAKYKDALAKGENATISLSDDCRVETLDNNGYIIKHEEGIYGDGTVFAFIPDGRSLVPPKKKDKGKGELIDSYIREQKICRGKVVEVYDYGAVAFNNEIGNVFIPKGCLGLGLDDTPVSLVKNSKVNFVVYQYVEDENVIFGSSTLVARLRLEKQHGSGIGMRSVYVEEADEDARIFEERKYMLHLRGMFDGSDGLQTGNAESVNPEPSEEPELDLLNEEERKREKDDGLDTEQSREELRPKQEVGSLAPVDELASLIGLSSIKQDVAELFNLVKMMKIRERRGMKSVPVSLHLVFAGNPGTGKTTVARILAQLYKEIGVLKTGQLIEVDRSDLVAGYVGQTALKTQEKIQEALGGILFIDEAYTLAKDGNDYGQEAIDTILKAMEDHRDEFIVIVAGYSIPMEKFINSNPGLKSRFSKYFFFPDYNNTELIQIFDSMCVKYDYRITEDAHDEVAKRITDMENNKSENFANARDVRNYFEKIITKQANRVGFLANATDAELSTINLQDVL